MPCQQDFVLPGIRADPTRLKALIVLTTFPYSRVWNRRRLESQFYGLWTQILSDLLFDLGPNAFLVPQLVIDASDRQPSDPNSSFRTMADDEANERIPDFVALVSAVKSREGRSSKERSVKDLVFPSSYSSWDSMQIIAALPAMIVQVKRSPPRSLPLQKDFITALHVLLNQAALEADECAAIAFSDKKNDRLQKIVLVAVSGEWWRFKVGLQDEYESVLDANSSSEDDEEDISDGEKMKQKKRRGKTRPRAMGQSLQRHKDLGPEYMATLEPDVEDTKPAARTWSKVILFRTPASNQRLYLIHELLKGIQQKVVHEVEQETGTLSEVSSEDEMQLKPGNAYGP